MKRFLVVLGCFVLFAAVSCAATPPQNYYEPFGVTNNPIGSKVGEALDSEGGILQAAQNGGITHISTVDIRHRVHNGKYTRTFVVTGE
ncbi:MAG: TRL-like family protein [Treponema sp.]|nr:TRL-like family protein [Treponema sp.]